MEAGPTWYLGRMENIDPKLLLERLNWRYATKQFDAAKRIPSDTWNTLEQSIVATPSSYGLQPWAFVVVDAVAVRRELRGASYGQAQVEDASHLVVMCSRDPYGMDDVRAHVKRMAEVRSVDVATYDKFLKVVESSLLGGKIDVARWADEQIYLALGQFMLSSALLGVDTCALGGIDHARFDEILGLRAKGLRTVVACAAGYRLDTDKYASMPKVRFPRERVILRA